MHGEGKGGGDDRGDDGVHQDVVLARPRAGVGEATTAVTAEATAGSIDGSAVAAGGVGGEATGCSEKSAEATIVEARAGGGCGDGGGAGGGCAPRSSRVDVGSSESGSAAVCDATAKPMSPHVVHEQVLNIPLR